MFIKEITRIKQSKSRPDIERITKSFLLSLSKDIQKKSNLFKCISMINDSTYSITLSDVLYRSCLIFTALYTSGRTLPGTDWTKLYASG